MPNPTFFHEIREIRTLPYTVTYTDPLRSATAAITIALLQAGSTIHLSPCIRDYVVSEGGVIGSEVRVEGGVINMSRGQYITLTLT